MKEELSEAEKYLIEHEEELDFYCGENECEWCGQTQCSCSAIMNCTCGAYNKNGAHIADCICGAD